MRVLHVIPNYPPARSYGGPIGSAHALCRHLALAGADVEVFTTDVDGPIHMDVPQREPVSLDGVSVHYYRGVPRIGYGASWDLARALATRVASFDVVHLHTVFTISTTLGSWACRARRVPYLICTRGMLTDWAVASKSGKKQLYMRAFDGANLRAAAAIHATSEAEASDLHARGFERVVVVPNAVEGPDEDIVAAPVRAAHGVPPDALLALYLGRLDHEKGVDIAIAATALAPAVHLVIAGDGPASYVAELRRQVARAAIADRIHFIGWLDGAEKWGTLASADLMLAPSRTESYGMSIAEALIIGCPVAVSDATPWQEVRDGGAGYIVPATAEAFAGALREAAASDEAARKRMRAAAKVVASRHRWDERAGRLMDIYRQVAAHRH